MRFALIFSLTLAACGSARGYRDASTAGENHVAFQQERAQGIVDADDRGGEDAKPARIVIYTADLRISVLSHENALASAASIARDAGGFVESSESQPSGSESRITLRVPVARFQETVRALAKLGTVLERNVKASDVTKEFLDTENRIALSRTARDRLYVLLKRVTDMKERVKILREIDRLTGEIDALTARSTYLKTRGDFSTITVSFASASSEVTLKRPSAFAWVRSLGHASRSLFDAHGVGMDRPQGFFDYSSSYYPSLFGFVAGTGESLFQSPDGTVIRAGSTKNYPRGTLSFWQTALQKELERRGYRILESKQDGKGWLFRTQITENLNTQDYTVYLIAGENWIHVAEAVFPSEASRALEPQVTAALRSLKGAD